ncbi:tripartite tricarboxylate transporter substrate binding protein [Comamonas terrigena]|uniref:Tripartite tricarboxylate transporter substrate binding protein n=2 Tax=Comamonadaceae TaxID=80864 RepID=A0A2A7UWJ0_COMTR|nr:tripartite tricarboxylate transporter substrate binding protein [Comamonas terrigena]PEH89660.1 tripartite tricarboxylate transporter substrate binding protein [Comamonas terrigena]BBL24869.1 hypothetical protein CT3_23240 [Comamonas terrigena NBRC 13299]
METVMSKGVDLKRRAVVGGLCMAWVPLMAQTKGAVTAPPELAGKTIKLIVGYPPGGGTDLTARTLAVYVGEYTGLTVIVENRPGAGGNIATDNVVRGQADPSNWLFVTQSQVITNPLLMKMSFEPMQELALLARASASPLVLIVRADSPFKSFDDIMAAHKKNPGSLNYGSAGIGTPQHIGVEWLKSLSGLQAVHTPYKGSGPCIMGLMSGEIDFVLESGAAASPHVRGGKVRAIGIAGSAKPDDFKDVRQIEASVPGFNMDAWSGVAVSKKVPATTRQYAEQVLQACLNNPDFIAKLKAQGGNPGWLSAAQFTQSVTEEARVTKDIVVKNNIRL